MLLSLLVFSALSAGEGSVAIRGNDFIFQSGLEAGQWVNVTGPNFWQCRANCNLVNGEFVDSGGGMALEALPGWVGGFRPSAVRVDASENPMFLLSVGLTPGGSDFGRCENYVRLEPCTLQVNDTIQRINLYQSGTVRKIEFFVND
jgi:hypothetical protein